MSRVQQALLKAPQLGTLENTNGTTPAKELDVAAAPGTLPRSAQAGSFPLPANAGTVNRAPRNATPAISDPASEQVLKLVRNLFLFQNSHAPRIVVFSSVEGTGSHEISLRSAELLAGQVSASVCLVSTNPSTSGGAQADKWYGLAEAVVSTDPIKNFVIRTNCRNLWLMPPGSSAASPNLLPPDRLRTRMIELKDEFDYVLIDAPPVISSPNAIVLGQIADGVVLILEANSTRRETARQAKETFEKGGVKLLGAVLNNRTFPIPEPLYRKL